MCAGLQGDPDESVLEYVPFGATPKTGAKTSKAGDLFLSAGLTSAVPTPHPDKKAKMFPQQGATSATIILRQLGQED